jgi:hypothetical protein
MESRLARSLVGVSELCNTPHHFLQRHNRAAGNPKSKMQSAAAFATMGMLMQAEQVMDADRVGFTFSFQIADQGKRRACSVRVDASNFHDASAQFRERWPLIESLARDFIRSGTANDGIIEVNLPQSPR